MINIKQQQVSIFLSLLIGSFFVFPLFYKTSYHLISAVLALFGLIFLIQDIKQHRKQHSPLKIDNPTLILIVAFVSYLIIPCISMLEHHAPLSWLDAPSKAVLLLPILAIFRYVKIKLNYLASIFLFACFVLGTGAIIQKFILGWNDPFIKYNRIIAGNITMATAILALTLAIYFHRIKNHRLTLISSLAFISVFIASLLCMNRGALVGFIFGFLAILWLNRDMLSKKLIVFFTIMTIICTIAAYQATPERWAIVKQEISQCLNENKCDTSIGLRLQFYKSSLKGFQEKPILGWGKLGTNIIHKKHASEGYVSSAVASRHYPHAHNIFFEFLTRYGILGVLSLLSIFCAPIWLYYKNIQQMPNNHLSQIFGIMGISFVLTIIGCGLTDVLMIHRIGNMFYFTVVILLVGLQQMTSNERINYAFHS